MDKLDNKQLEMELRMCLATISGYHPDSHATQILISSANKGISELVGRINTPKHETVEELWEAYELIIDLGIHEKEVVTYGKYEKCQCGNHNMYDSKIDINHREFCIVKKATNWLENNKI